MELASLSQRAFSFSADTAPPAGPAGPERHWREPSAQRSPNARGRGSLLLAALLLLPLAPALAATADLSHTAPVYREPSPELVRIVDTPPTPTVSVAPGGGHLLLLHRPSHPDIAELAAPELRLAGLRLDPVVTGPSRWQPLVDLSLVRLADGTEVPVTGLPPEPRLGNVTWSPDGARFAFTHTGQERIEAWVGEVATGQARRLAEVPINLAGGTSPRWLPDGSGLVAALVPAGRGPEPAAPPVPPGPVIRESRERAAPARTYQDLLANPHDEALFTHYLTAQLAILGLDGGVAPLGEPALWWSFSPSPDGRYLLVESLQRPFSYLVPAFRFPRRVEVWTRSGEPVRVLADLPLQEEVPMAFGSVPTGPRRHTWRADAPATVLWAEALDGGDAGVEADPRDRLVLLDAPFDGEPVPLVTLSLRYATVHWGDGRLALVQETWWRTRTRRTWRLAPDHPDRPATLLFDHNWEDRYNDPGSPATTTNAAGRSVLLTGDDGQTLYLAGMGASPDGNRPFVDAFDLASRQTRRLFHSQPPHFEQPVEVLDPEAGLLLTRRESVAEPPNYFLRRLGSEGQEAELMQLTDFPHPTPQLVGATKELIRYHRDDGVELSGTLHLPPGWQPADGPLPTLLWAYPREFRSADFAGQNTDSPHRFDRIGSWSPLIWLAAGFAVLSNPTMPIVGEGDEEPNDTYVAQLVASAEAAVGELVRRGVSEPGRIAIGGHSYGAFMAANLLAHSDLFAAGIARSGAYNRTLTPFGFQAEERSLWEAPEVYFKMSPFLHAQKIRQPLLLIHGEADNNSGTYPMQSERFYNALQGHGATVRLVMLPHESHGYRARQSLLHMLWETERWLEEFVRDPGNSHTSLRAPTS